MGALRSSTFVPALLALVACGGSDDATTGGSAGSSTAGSGGASAGKAGAGAAGQGGASAGGKAGSSAAGKAGSSTAGSSTAGSSTAGSSAAGKAGAAGSGTAGTNAAGSGTAGSGTAGTGTAGSGTAGSGTAGSGAAGASGAPSTSCAPLPASGATTMVAPAQAKDLAGIVGAAKPGDSIALGDGTYDVSGMILHVTAKGVTIRGASGDASKVVLDQKHTGGGELFLVQADDVTLTDLTIRNARNHAVHVAPTGGGELHGGRIHRVVVEDPGQQGIKGNSDGQNHWPHEVEISCSRITLGDAGRAVVPTVNGGECYTGGIDVHGGRSWRVRDSVIEGFWCPGGPSYPSEHGIHFWNGARDTVIERNVIVNCARGIGLGLGDGTWGSPRTWPDDPCPAGKGVIMHYGGVVRNNVVHADDPGLFASSYGFDVGIDLQQACGATVVHNTVVSTTEPAAASIHCRYQGTTATMKNNLTNGPVKEQCAAADVGGNVTGATAALFTAPASHDLHLVAGASAKDAGVSLSAGVCDDDLDGEPRTGARDVGADELP